MADGLHSDIVCVGFAPSALTQEQRKRLNAWVTGHKKGDLISMHVYPNVDTTAASGIPSGVKMRYSPSATVDAGALSDTLFEHVGVSPLLEGEAPLNDGYFATQVNALADSVQQFSGEPVQGKIRNVKTNEDLAHWESELGGPNSLVGVYSKLGDDLRSKTYHLAARSSVPAYAADFKRAVAQLKPTYQQLLTDPEWIRRMSYGHNAAERNTHRNIAAAAEALGVAVARRNDDFSLVDNDNHAVPEMALPEWTRATHAIRSAVVDKKPVVEVYHNVLPATESGERVFVLGSPYDGLYSFPISNATDLHVAGGLPLDTGRFVGLSEVPTDNARVFEKRAQGFTWEGPDAINAALHPDAFRPINEAFKASLKRMGWNAEQHEGRFVPVCVKIYNDKLKSV